MADKFYGSLDLTKILEKAREGHSAFRKADNGHIYFNINMWLNDQPDKYGNTCSLQLGVKKDAAETEKKQYIGNMKKSEQQESAPAASDIPDASEFEEKLPF